MQNTLFKGRIGLARLRTVLFFLALISLTLTLSLGFGVIINEWWAFFMLILPSYSASRSIVEGFVMAGHKHKPLERIDISSKELSDEKTAIVLHTTLDKGFDSDALSARLLKLSDSESIANLKVLALVDLCPENAKSTADDEFTVQSLSQMTQKLNEKTKDRFCVIVRKRAFSEGQEEYICPNGRRGALLELAEYLHSGKGDFFATLGDTEWLIGARYISAVSQDCLLGMNAASKLLSIALHPSNKIRLENGKITSGFGIIAPKTEPMLKSSLSSGFSKVFGLKSKEDDLFSGAFRLADFMGFGLLDMYYYLQTEGMIPFEKHVLPEIIEGELLRCAYAKDVIFYKEFPDTPQAYYRKKLVKASASLQNLRLIFSRRLNAVSKSKLMDNFLITLVPISVFANAFFAFWSYSPAAEFAALLSLAMYLFPSLFEAIRLTLLKNDYEQQFYSGLLPSSVWAIKNVAYSVVMLPTLATKSLMAMIITAFKIMIGKKLMSIGGTKDPISFYILPEILSLALVASPSYAIRLLGLIFSLMPALLAASEQESKRQERRLSFKEQKELSQYIADSWKFFEDYVTSVDNGLPPERVQFSPIFKITHKTSPSSIGLYLLSCLGAYDQKLISASSMALRIEETISSLERMERLCGCYFESYDTVTLAPLSDKVVCEENGVLLASLTALKEGLDELGQIFDKAGILAERISRLLQAADTSIFYNKKSMLMAKSVDRNLNQSDERHTFFMEPASLASFYSIATQSVPSAHWQALGRTTLKNGFYCGFGSPSGSLEEFFLPEIFLKSPEGSSRFESQKYALWTQKRLGQKKGLPFGLSKCFVNSFDLGIEYIEKSLGAPHAAILNKSSEGYAASPYSSFLALQYDPHGCMENLKKLKNAGGYCGFGFYEAVDYSGITPSCVKCLISKHVGEMITSGVNALCGGVMQKRFMNSRRISGGWPLLEERFLPANSKTKLEKKSLHESHESFCDISPIQPRARLLFNGSYSLCAFDCGTCLAWVKDKDIYKRTVDPVFEKQGFFAGIRLESGLIMLDDYTELLTQFDESGVRYIKNCGDIKAEMKVCLHENLECEIRRFRVTNTSENDIDLSLLVFISPSLGVEDESYLRVERDDKLRSVIVSRVDSGACVAIGFANKEPFSASFDLESVFAGKDSIKEAFESVDDIPPSLISEPKPCVFMKAKLSVEKRGEQALDMYIIYAASESELRNKLEKLLEHPIKEHVPKNTAAQALCGIILSNIMFKKQPSLDALTRISRDISQDALMLLILNDINDSEKLALSLSAYKELREANVNIQLAVLFNDMNSTERKHYNMLLETAQNASAQQYIYSRGGIHPIDESLHGDYVRKELIENASFVFSDDILPEPIKREPFLPIEIKKCSPKKVDIDEDISFGGFSGDDYIITSRPEVEWRHVLSNSVFGTTLKSSSLGQNSFGDFKERLILELDEKYYDIINGATARFSFNGVKYYACGEGFESEVAVEIAQKGVCKRMRVKITSKQRCRLAYVCDLSDTSEFVERDGNSAIIRLESGGFCAVSSSKANETILSKNAFFSGRWNSDEIDSKFCARVCTLSGAEEICFYLSHAKNKKAVVKLHSLFEPQKVKLLGTREQKWLKYQLLHANVNLSDEHGNLYFGEVLQNAASLASFDHKRSKQEIIRCCKHQLSEGGVQKTWRKDIRNESELCYDAGEVLWLPYAVSEYIKLTLDKRILDLSCRYFEIGSPKESVYEHCRRAIEFCISQKGAHGLISNSDGTESVALSEMMIIVLKSFCEIAKLKGDNMYGATLLYNSKQLADAITRFGRDSGQYIGGYLKSGEVFGTQKCESGKIYLLPQALAVLADLDEKFDKSALIRAYETLYDQKRGVVKALTPPYKADDNLQSTLKYLPAGIGENGGAITKASVLFAKALEKSGFKNEAENVLKSLFPLECASSAGYKAEPYYVCGEVYTNKNCFLRGGKPIFNTAAGWLLQISDKEQENNSAFDEKR